MVFFSQDETPGYRELTKSVQSANSLFHFMSKREFLFEAIKNKALCPRYCNEDLKYLGLINADGTKMNSVNVLEVCFCDIKLHSIFNKFEIENVKGVGYSLSNEEIKDLKSSYNSHPCFYGSYAIAFSKEWSIKNGIEPVQYVTKNSLLIECLRESFNEFIKKDDISEKIACDYLRRLAFIKPIDGQMRRSYHEKTIECTKNFHDEREWRFVPGFNKSLSFFRYNEPISSIELANDSNKIKNDKVYDDLKLFFNYEDVKYIIVKNNEDAKEMLNFVQNLSGLDQLNKDSLIMKILVLEDIRKDW